MKFCVAGHDGHAARVPEGAEVATTAARGNLSIDSLYRKLKQKKPFQPYLKQVGMGLLITAFGVPVYMLCIRWRDKPVWFQQALCKTLFAGCFNFSTWHHLSLFF